MNYTNKKMKGWLNPCVMDPPIKLEKTASAPQNFTYLKLDIYSIYNETTLFTWKCQYLTIFWQK